MIFKIVINCDNAAFGDYPFDEIARILEEQARKLRYNSDRRPVDWSDTLRDTNGNKVGASGITEF